MRLLSSEACADDGELRAVIEILTRIGPSLGPLLGGIGLCIGAAAAWTTFIFYHRKSMYEAWVAGYRLLYAEFWKDETIGKVRRWIVSDEEYLEVEKILRKRGGRSN